MWQICLSYSNKKILFQKRSESRYWSWHVSHVITVHEKNNFIRENRETRITGSRQILALLYEVSFKCNIRHGLYTIKHMTDKHVKLVTNAWRSSGAFFTSLSETWTKKKVKEFNTCLCLRFSFFWHILVYVLKN